MNIKINQARKAGIIYAAQVAALWGFLEAYTYFKDDALKNFLGPYWIAIYILPVIPTAYAFHQWRRENRTTQVISQQSEFISTEGDYSPGKVRGNYTVQNSEELANQISTSVKNRDITGLPDSADQPSKNISTKGNYSPGEVGGDYKIGQ